MNPVDHPLGVALATGKELVRAPSVPVGQQRAAPRRANTPRDRLVISVAAVGNKR